MKRLELAFYCCNPRNTPCPKTHCIVNGHACLFLKAQWETRLKESTPADNASLNHSLAAAEPKEATLAESNIKHAKQKPSEEPCNFNVESKRIMEGCKK